MLNRSNWNCGRWELESLSSLMIFVFVGGLLMMDTKLGYFNSQVWIQLGQFFLVALEFEGFSSLWGQPLLSNGILKLINLMLIIPSSV